MGITITVEQGLWIGAVAAVIAQLVKLWAAKSGKQVPQLLLSLVIFVVSLVLAYLWARPAIPAWPAPVPDPMVYALLILGWIGELIVLAGTLLGFAKVIYDLLFKKFFEKFNIGNTKADALTTDYILSHRLQNLEAPPYSTNPPASANTQKRPEPRK